jgi:multicomponent Na+:H+ antiporter subunit C
MIAEMDIGQALGLYNYWVVIFLMMTGFYMVIARGNLIKTIIGLNIFQTSVVLLYVTMGKVKGGTAPIMPPSEGHGHGHDDHGHEAGLATVDAVADPISFANTYNSEAGVVSSSSLADSIQLAGFEDAAHGHADTAHQAAEAIYSNPLPSVLMLTAIVVGVATTALALALTVRIREEYGTIEEDEILEMDRTA